MAHIDNRSRGRRVVVSTLDPEPASWDLPAAEPHDRTDVAGGIRTLHELAVALAACGHEVELRGPASTTVLAALGEAAGATPALPGSPRRPLAGEVVVIPNGGYDLTRYARAVLSPARLVVAVLSPTGQSGWPFVSPWYPQPHLTVPLDSLCRPEHFRAMAALGADLWTNMQPIPGLAHASGCPCTFIGSGDPCPPPPLPAEKDLDVAYLQANRWRPLAERVSRMLARPAHAIPQGDHESVMAELGRARIMLWPSRVEGDGRLLREARMRGTVVVGLASNVYATGLHEQAGALACETLGQMAQTVEALLHDPARLSALAYAARASAIEQVDWKLYLQRVEQALATTLALPADPAASARGAFGERLAAMLRERVHAIDRVQELDVHLADARGRVGELDGELERARQRIEELQDHLDDARAAVRRLSNGGRRAVPRAAALARRLLG